MAFNSNTVAGTVVHAQSQWNTKLIVPNDISIASSTTYQSILKFDLGKYERAVFRCYLEQLTMQMVTLSIRSLLQLTLYLTELETWYLKHLSLVL